MRSKLKKNTVHEDTPFELPWSYATYYWLAIGLLILQGMLNGWICVRFPQSQNLALTVTLFSAVFIFPTGVLLYMLARLQNGKPSSWMEWAWALAANRGTQKERIHISLLCSILPLHLLFGTAQALYILGIDVLLRSWIALLIFIFIFIPWLIVTYLRLKITDS